MRLPSFLLPFALLLSISSISAETLMMGTWSNPYTKYNSNSYCCIPTSIEIKSSGSSGYTAYYKYSSSFDSPCWNLFLSRTDGNMQLYKYTSSNNTETAYSEVTFFGSQTFNFQAFNTTGSPRLNIFSSAAGCDFTMSSRIGQRFS